LEWHQICSIVCNQKINANIGGLKIMNFLTTSWMERVLFAVVIVGILLTLFGLVRIVDTTIKINNNSAQQFHDSGETLDIQNTEEGRGLMASDLERRELLKIRGEMIMLVGIGLAILGLGWLGYDFRNGRLRKEDEPTLAEAS
jgi:hypothetical protein